MNFAHPTSTFPTALPHFLFHCTFLSLPNSHFPYSFFLLFPPSAFQLSISLFTSLTHFRIPTPKSLFTVLPFPFRIPTSLILSLFSFPLPHSHFPFPYLLPLSNGRIATPKSLFTVLPFPFRIPTSLILSFLSFPLPHSHFPFPYLLP
jgi:hypothetical protein